MIKISANKTIKFDSLHFIFIEQPVFIKKKKYMTGDKSPSLEPAILSKPRMSTN
jgi:hypothetical protein